MAEGARIVEEARRWLGTPYVHQAARCQAGCDCLGLVRGIWVALYGAEPEPLPAYTPDWGEVGARDLLIEGALRHMRPVTDDLRTGDVLVFRMRAGAVAKHLGVVSQLGAAPHFIHAYDRHGVVESPLSAPWRSRIAARFRFP